MSVCVLFPEKSGSADVLCFGRSGFCVSFVAFEAREACFFLRGGHDLRVSCFLGVQGIFVFGFLRVSGHNMCLSFLGCQGMCLGVVSVDCRVCLCFVSWEFRVWVCSF